MKLVKLPPDSTSYWLPTFKPESGGQRGLFFPGEYAIPKGQAASACLACIDTPCRTFTQRDVSAPVAIDTPVYPDLTVCPVDALTILGGSGIPTVDEALCVGCGICVARCPVGAIHLDPDSAVAVISEPTSEYELQELTFNEFISEREVLARAIRSEDAPYADAGRVRNQIRRINEHLVRGNEQRTFRLLARNGFLTLGYAARLKNPGDNNAFAELVVGEGENVILLEIETGGDTLDAFRRSMSGVAVARSRYGVSPEQIAAGVVLDRLPNERVDYYEAVKNAAARIGVELRSLPVAALLLGIRSCDDRLIRFLLNTAVADSDHRSLERAVERLWGAAPNTGLRPEK